MLGGIFGGEITFFILIFLVTAGCSWELTGLMFPEENFRKERRILGTIFGVLPYFFIASDWPGGFPEGVTVASGYLLTFGLFLTFVVELFFAARQPFTNVAYYLLCAFYIGCPFALLSEMSAQYSDAFNPSVPVYHPLRVFGLLLLIWTNDTMAYFVGSKLGRRKLFERISPKKTWEGTIGGGICAVLVAWLLSLYIPDFTRTQWLALAVVAAIFGTLGDLVESMLKRSVGVKDSGNLLPGHGGLLDRFDAFIFTLPFYWLTLMLVPG